MTTNDPRKSQGSISGGAPHERGTAVIDATNAVLLDNIHSCMVEPRKGAKAAPPAVALSLAGRINKTPERSEVVYLFDPQGAAALCADLIGLMHRAGFGEQFIQLLDKNLDRQP